MISKFHHLPQRLINITLALFLGLCLIVAPLNANAAKTFMSGDFVKDTISVSKVLKETIEIPKGTEGLSEEEKEAVFLISDYISRYRNRSQVNNTVTFTTMQTALNALAGHYKTFTTRPVPEKLKERLNKELSQAEKLVIKET